MRLFGRRYDTAEAICLETLDGKIAGIAPAKADRETLSRWPWIAPGLIDIQMNGYGGQWFSSADLSPEKVVGIAHTMTGFGVTRFLPTLTTQSFEMLRHAMQTIVAACESSALARRMIPGIHLEGPYVSPIDGPRGAHPLAHCRRPDWDEFQRLQEAAAGRIRVHTVSAEFAESPAFIAHVADSGVVVAIGHTAANSDQIRAAVDAGARLSTHLGNGSHRELPRFPNYLWDQLAEDRLVASLIVDGHHLPPAVVKTFLRAKTPSRCILVSDMAGIAGMSPGRYPTSLGDVEILADGRIVPAGQRTLLAGASRPVGTGVANVIHFADVDLATAIQMAVGHPVRLLGLESPQLAVGEPADLVQFRLEDVASGRPPFDVCATFLNGQVVWGDPWLPAAAS